MNTIEIKPNVTVAVPEILTSLSRMDMIELESFFSQVSNLVEERKQLPFQKQRKNCCAKSSSLCCQPT